MNYAHAEDFLYTAPLSSTQRKFTLAGASVKPPMVSLDNEVGATPPIPTLAEVSILIAPIAGTSAPIPTLPFSRSVKTSEFFTPVQNLNLFESNLIVETALFINFTKQSVIWLK